MLKLFFTFFKIGLFTFGGGYGMIPLISEEVAQFGITDYQLQNFIAISESTPGPFSINIATFIGYSNYGFIGALIATLGVILPSFFVILLIAIFIKKIRKTSFFKSFITITTPIVSGLILSSTIKITQLNLFNISSITSIASDFKLNNLTIITLSILLVTILVYYLIKKKRISPFLLIVLAFIFGNIAFFINSL